MFTSSMSEIAKPKGEDINNASEQALDSDKSHPQPIAPQLRSQNLQEIQRQGRQGASKTQLVLLMAQVRLQQMGYPRSQIKAFLSREQGQLSQLQEVQLCDLSETALDIVAIYIQQRSQQPLIIARNSRGRSRRSSVPLPDIIQQSDREQPPKQFAQLHLQFRQPFRQILCSICYLLTTQFSEQTCRHAFCEQCLTGYIRQNIGSGNYAINCPEYNCRQPISSEQLRHLLIPNEYQRYIYFKDKNEKELNPDNKFCSKPDCGEVLARSETGLTCSKCKAVYCEVCMQGAHEGNCDAALKNTLEQTYQDFHIKKCPNCKSPIEKSEGCNHMNCKKCHHEFCWICLKPYSHYHYKYYNCFGCPGMQFEDEDALPTERTKQVLLYLSLPLILAVILASYLAAIPIYMVGTFLYKPLDWLSSSNMFEQSVGECCCGWMPHCLQSILLWFMFQPRAVLYAVFVAPLKITAMVCGGLCRAFQ